ncbi:MAG: Rpn family recombination-promoting nuclease/putative transposase [Treponemataceae bacterium]|nr:Rpn family recombination-promoting nuclease/putative transposase [Spirochaetales bacterium]MDY6030203.1 Rpn family recombination-promoting nuclease/putative transposase [Treponemataceae bacterium]
MPENREVKSSVFADLFCDDEIDGKKNFLSLYNAIHGTNLTLEDTVLERKIIPQAIYKTFNNDISMLVNGKLIVLVEHQSTLNKNLPLRFLEYYVHILYGIVPHKARYKDNLYKIPTPEFYVFYNGQRKPKHSDTLKLSDAFIEPQEKPQCELTVKFADINLKHEQNLPILQSCDILKQYCEFMEIIFRYQSELKKNPTSEEAQNCYEKAIHEAISRNILAEYLTRKGSEVINMFIGEYDYDLDMQVKAEEAFEDGKEAGLEQGAHDNAVQNTRNLLAMNILTPEQIAQATGLPLEEVLALQKKKNA